MGLEFGLTFSDDYLIKWSDSHHKTVVGRVIAHKLDDQSEYLIDIEKSDLNFKKTGSTIIGHTFVKKKNQLIPMIGVTQWFIDYPQEVKDGLIWHEIGHIHYKHVLKNKLTQDQLRIQRLVYINNNDVQPIELEADIFAAKKFGKLKYIDVLRYVKDHRPMEDTNLFSSIGKKEYDLRITKIYKLVQ
jgi:hypothetical protein